jgi:hypothetical protein
VVEALERGLLLRSEPEPELSATDGDAVDGSGAVPSDDPAPGA